MSSAQHYGPASGEDRPLWHEPVEAIMVAASWTESSGWHLSVAHSHRFGAWTDCQRDEYDRLTTGELLDVVTAVVAELQDYDR